MLGTIARRVGLRIDDIRRWNQIEGDLIRVGQTLSLRGGLPPEPTQPTTPASSADAAAWKWHTVEAGESYWSIARDHPGVDLADLLAVLGGWGPCPGCVEDFDDDEVVGMSDLLTVLSVWAGGSP